MTDFVVGPDVDLETEDLRDSRGRRITEEYVRSAVADVQAKVGRGRPSLSGVAETSPEVKARVPAALKARLVEVAQQEGRSTSAVIRDALEHYLAS